MQAAIPLWPGRSSTSRSVPDGSVRSPGDGRGSRLDRPDSVFASNYRPAGRPTPACCEWCVSIADDLAGREVEVEVMAMTGSPVAALRAASRSLDRRVAATPAWPGPHGRPDAGGEHCGGRHLALGGFGHAPPGRRDRHAQPHRPGAAVVAGHLARSGHAGVLPGRRLRQSCGLGPRRRQRAGVPAPAAGPAAAPDRGVPRGLGRARGGAADRRARLPGRALLRSGRRRAAVVPRRLRVGGAADTGHGRGAPAGGRTHRGTTRDWAWSRWT